MRSYDNSSYDLREESRKIGEALEAQARGIREQIIQLSKEIEQETLKRKLAAAEGDLRENAAYQTATENLSRLNVEMRNLSAKEDAFKKFSGEYESSGFIGIGTTVHITTGTKARAIKLVPSDLGDGSIGAVSINSPVGKALIGKSKGDEVTVTTQAKTIDYKIVDIY